MQCQGRCFRKRRHDFVLCIGRAEDVLSCNASFHLDPIEPLAISPSLHPIRLNTFLLLFLLNLFFFLSSSLSRSCTCRPSDGLYAAVEGTVVEIAHLGPVGCASFFFPNTTSIQPFILDACAHATLPSFGFVDRTRSRLHVVL